MTQPSGRRILVVADDPLMRRLAGDGLLENGFQITNAASVSTAHAILQDSRQIDLLVVDLDLPPVGGVSLARDARSIYPSLPVLFIANRGEIVDRSREEVVQSGFDVPFGVMNLSEAHAQLSVSRVTLDWQQDGKAYPG